MGDWWEDLAFSIIFTLLKNTVKNPDSKAKNYARMRKLYYMLEVYYPEVSDEFHKVNQVRED